MEYINIIEDTPAFTNIENTPASTNIDSKVYFPDLSAEDVCSCSVAEFYGETDDGNLKRDNMFSEFTDNFQRAKARENLGIPDKYTLQWGNIDGNIVNQIDLCNYIDEAIKKALAKLK